MLVGIFADAHDHADNVRHAVRLFNDAGVGLVLFAGDLVSPLCVPPLRKLHAPLVACFGDNDGNRRGIAGGLRVVGTIADPPLCVVTRDGCRILLAHQLGEVRDCRGGADVVVTAHTHRAAVRDRRGRPAAGQPGRDGRVGDADADRGAARHGNPHRGDRAAARDGAGPGDLSGSAFGGVR